MLITHRVLLIASLVFVSLQIYSPIHISAQGKLPYVGVGFTSEWMLPGGLIHLRARTYSPSEGRFLQRDLFAGFSNRPQSLNRFYYNDPINTTDPSGYSSINGQGPRIFSPMFADGGRPSFSGGSNSIAGGRGQGLTGIGGVGMYRGAPTSPQILPPNPVRAIPPQPIPIPPSIARPPVGISVPTAPRIVQYDPIRHQRLIEPFFQKADALSKAAYDSASAPRANFARDLIADAGEGLGVRVAIRADPPELIGGYSYLNTPGDPQTLRISCFHSNGGVGRALLDDARALGYTLGYDRIDLWADMRAVRFFVNNGGQMDCLSHCTWPTQPMPRYRNPLEF